MNLEVNKLIVICATQRCGSTMVVEDMRATGVLGVPEEYFIPWNPEKTEIDWQMQLASIAKKASSENGIAAVKVMADQLQNIDACLSSSLKEKLPESDGLFPHFRALTKNASYIFIRRDSIVRQAISRGMSRQTGINHATGSENDDHFAGNLLKGYDKSYNDKAKYKENVIDRDVIKISKENLTWERYFDSWGIKHPLTLRYEEICKNSPGYLQRIAKTCSLNLSEDQLPSSRKMVRLSNSKNDDWTEEYRLSQSVPTNC